MNSTNLGSSIPQKEVYSVETACNPSLSVIVSACAGSGKTWLLVARMMRLLLAGASPQEILALTFTRKAAQEMRDRLYGLLEQLSIADDNTINKELTDRGLTKEQAIQALPKAKKLYEQVLANPQPIVIDTFHGWFGKLLGAAPASIGIKPGFSLREDGKRLLNQCLDDWWGCLKPELKQRYDVLLQYFGAHETQKLLTGNGSLLKQRGAWTFFLMACEVQRITPSECLKQYLPRLNDPNPLLEMWNATTSIEGLAFLEKCLENSSKQEIDLLEFIRPALECKRQGGDVLEVVDRFQYVFLTKESEYRSNNNKALSAVKIYLKNEGFSNREQEYVTYKQDWGKAFLAYIDWRREQDIYSLNEAWFSLSESMIKHVDKVKESICVRDFDDLEIGVSKLVVDFANSAYLQSRLDAKYKHILVDEFQDTNPLQWQVLRSWFEGYGQDGSRPSVFIVGDPKQSIYRFRRADPRLFSSAKKFLQKEFAAVLLEQDKTRRNAPIINQSVNAVFSSDQVPIDYLFAWQETLWKPPELSGVEDTLGKNGEVYILPLIAREDQDSGVRSGSAFDAAIVDPDHTADAAQRYSEGQVVGRLIQHIMVSRLVVDKQNGHDVWRKPRESDFLLLVKRRKYLPQFERALREVGLAYESTRLGGLLNTLEVDDIIALLTVLVTPRHDLPLAQVLRSPIFSLTEQQMQKLATAKSMGHFRSWWDALQNNSDAYLTKAAQYLKHWYILGQRLPVHDLLDRIYQDSHLRMKYAAVSQEIDRAQILANLDAFLELALNQDGGRYPSLSRFINEINEIRRGDDDETPDEGEVEMPMDLDLVELDGQSEMAEDEQNKRVRLMTIHGAKGLESPFVIILDANHTDTKKDYSGVLLDWSPDDYGPSHLSLFTSKTLTVPRQKIYDNENEIGEKENWNLLYVAMTRAKQGLWISGDAKKGTSNNPSGLDDISWYGKAKMANIPVFDSSELTIIKPFTEIIVKNETHAVTDKLISAVFSIEDFIIDWDLAKESFQKRLLDIESGVDLKVFESDGEDDEMDSDMLQEGVYFHKLLEHFTSQVITENLDEINAKEIAAWLDVDEASAIRALERARKVLTSRLLKPYLNSERWIQAWNEIDLINQAGKSFRIDRLIEFEDRLVILDFKLTIPKIGNLKRDLYRTQIQNYIQELARIRPDKPIEGYLVSSEGLMERL